MESAARQAAPEEAGSVSTDVLGVTLLRLPAFREFRGVLSVAETGAEIPFDVKRFFVVAGVAADEVRGQHAHHTLHQMLVCVHGSCEVVADDGRARQSFLLDDPSVALVLPPLVWGVQHCFSADAVLVVLASEKYDAADYIRDYDEFLRLVKASR